MELDAGFKDRVKWALQSKDLTQSDLARHLGFTPQAIQQWVAGVTLSPRREHVLAAADFTGCRYEWLAYGRGPMREPAAAPEPPQDATEQALLAREWERSLLAALPETERAHWHRPVPHPTSTAQLIADWLADDMLAEVGLYRSAAGLVSGARIKLWLVTLLREILPPGPRQSILLLAPLESWAPRPDREIAAIRAEARALNIDVELADSPAAAAAVLSRQQTPAVLTNAELGLDSGLVL